FVGNVQPAVQRERLAWLGRLAGLAERWRGGVEDNVYGEDYRALLRRARVVFNRALRRECNIQLFESMTSGALLLQEEDHLELPALLEPGKHYVAYSDADLEERLEHYLSHEDDRQRIASAGRERAFCFSFGRLWAEQVEWIERDLPQ